MEIEQRITGTVKWFDPSKGYGFIEVSGRPDVFIHISTIKHLEPCLIEKGDEIEFAIGPGKKDGRMQATKVSVL
jgi:CspA family cold shock protein